MHAPQISCCFSGYRPGKLPWGNDENDPRCRALKARLRDVMEAAYDEGYRHFICGMAQGCIIWSGADLTAFFKCARMRFPQCADGSYVSAC